MMVALSFMLTEDIISRTLELVPEILMNNDLNHGRASPAQSTRVMGDDRGQLHIHADQAQV